MRPESRVPVVQWPEVITVRFLHGREDSEGVRPSFYPSTPGRSDVSIFRPYRTKTPSARHYPRTAIAVMNCPKRFQLRDNGQRNPVSKHPSRARTHIHKPRYTYKHTPVHSPAKDQREGAQSLIKGRRSQNGRG